MKEFIEQKKNEFYSNYAPDQLGENQMVLLTDEVTELWDFIISTI